MSGCDHRRMLIHGESEHGVLNRLQTIAEVLSVADLTDRSTWGFAVREARGGWIQLDVPPDLPIWHLHNLTRGFLQDPTPPTVILTSAGPDDWDYWLTRSAMPERLYLLAGATGTGMPFQVDIDLGRLFDHPDVRIPPLPTKIALLTRGVHGALLDEDNDVPISHRFELTLPDVPDTPWVIPPPSNLADEFDIERIEPKRGLSAMVDWVLKSR